MRAVMVVAALASTLVLSTGALAAEKRAEFIPALNASQFDTVQRLLQARLAQDPCNADAVLVKTELALTMGVDDLDGLLKLVDQCASKDPDNSVRQEARGIAYAVKILNGGTLTAIGNAGKIKDALSRALELDPKNLGARKALLQYYLMAPAIAGGGRDKARILAQDAEKIDPEAAQMMRLLVDTHDNTQAKAVQQLLATKAADYEHQVLQREVLTAIAQVLSERKKYPEAQAIFQRLREMYPEQEIGAYGAGRVYQMQGQHAQASSWFEKALQINPHSARTWFRIGQVLQAQGGQVARAREAYQKALSIKPGISRRARDEVEEALQQLKG